MAIMIISSTGGMSMGLLLVAAGDAVRLRSGAGRDQPGSGSMSFVRMGFSLGFVAGAPLGGILAQTLGYAGLLGALGVGLLVVAGLAPFVLPETGGHSAAAGRARTVRGSMWPLVIFCLAGVLVMISDQAKTQFLPLRLTQQLHFMPATVGALFGFQALLELISMPLAGRIADRIGAAPVLLVTFALPVPYLLGVSSTTNVALLFALQLLQASAVAGFSALAFVQAQALAPGREGFATTLYGAGFSASQLTAGLLVGGMAQWVGVAGSLRLSAVPVVLGCLLLAGSLRGRAAVEPAPAAVS
jgi:SET family sugar efflux transporter-like MFS transporter